ncbi:glycosyl hydrolase [Sphingobium sp. CAP-1]|uniref:glycosyl hydrolase n=1 Tax=Sphingobium sp. CAP-1 TaxID=2676077 RepID=UPI0012BB3C63|nr:glycosyl hydrolase [Sphingobium sp. CAP-1]QGP80456.1 hypothetical protein GL174_15075 [Sphingobium sp. CAP-1]
MTRHRLFRSVALTCLAMLTGCATDRVAGPENKLALTAKTFRDPPASVRPIYRWWLPLAAVDPDELRRELDQMADAGAGGVEVAAMPVPGDIGHDAAFLREHGFGTPRWTATLETIFEKARERNLRVDMMVGPLWPTALPSVNALNDPAAQQRLVAGYAQMAPGASWATALPLPQGAVPSVKSVLCAPMQAGERRVNVQSIAGLAIGDMITIGEGDDADRAAISALTGPQSGQCGATVVLAAPAAHGHSIDSPVVDEAKRTLVAVLAAQCLSSECPITRGKRTLDPASVKNLTRRARKDGTLKWTAPGGKAPWYLIAFYQTADGQKLDQMSATTPNYVIDHIGKAGARAVADFYDRSVLTPRLRALIRNSAGSALFEDSYEPEEGLKWTWSFAREFARRRGYPITRALPVLANAGVGARLGAFDFPDVGERLREDYRQTWSDLYGDNHMRPYKAWANSLGMHTRLQIEGGPMEMGDLAALADIPEGENRNFLNNPQFWKIVGVGAQIRAHEVPLSTECCPIDAGVWATTVGGKPFTVAQGTGAPNGRAGNNSNLNWVYKAYAGGVNQLVWHGFPYLTTPEGSGPRSRWPGNSMDGNSSFSEAFGPRMPQWPDYRRVNDHLARLQLAMRQGRARYDLAIFWHDFGVEGIAPNVTPYSGYPGLSKVPTTTSALNDAGFTYQFVSPAYFNATTVRQVRDGVWLPDSIGVKAIILNNQRVMPLASLQRIADLVRKGNMPLIVVGALPERTAGAATETGDDARLQALAAELNSLANMPGSRVRMVDSLDAVPGALASLGISPAAAHISDPASSAILAVRRRTADADYYLLFNQSTDAATQTLELEGQGVPYELDTWSGRIHPIGLFERTPAGVRMQVRVGANDAKLFALGFFGGAVDAVHAVTSTGPAVRTHKGALVLRTDRNGIFETKLSDGSTVRTAVDGVIPPIRLDRWTLARESWTADASGAPGLDHRLKTVLPDIELRAGGDGTLPSWTQFEPIDAAGVGLYTATFTLPAGWTVKDGALLDLGQVIDTFRITVNGIEVEPSSYQDTSTIDIGPQLHPGQNRILVRVATPLRNAVKAYLRSGVKRLAEVGLIGPVILHPYREEEVSKDGQR